MMRWRQARPWLFAAFATYLALAAIELGRSLRYDRPEAEVGLFPRETAPESSGREGAVFRWTRANASLLRRVQGPVLRVPLLMTGRPDMPPERLVVDLLLDDQPLTRVAIDRPGWTEVAAYIPPLLGPGRWGEVVDSLSWTTSQARDSIWQELRPWRRHGAPPRMWLGVRPHHTFVPARLSDNPDRRQLGVGIGNLEWQEDVGPEGLGFHEWESDPRGVPFRWTGRWASQPMDGKDEDFWIWLRASHPDIDQRPVEVTFFRGANEVRTEVLTTHRWRRVDFQGRVSRSDEGESPVLSLRVDRTWSPARHGVPDDTRELGVAMSSLRRPRAR